jgi:hypothetical protein
MLAMLVVDSKTKLIHSMETTAANVHDAKPDRAAAPAQSRMFSSVPALW